MVGSLRHQEAEQECLGYRTSVGHIQAIRPQLHWSSWPGVKTQDWQLEKLHLSLSSALNTFYILFTLQACADQTWVRVVIHRNARGQLMSALSFQHAGLVATTCTLLPTSALLEE